MNKPQIIYGIKYWYNQQDQLHRDDGPAVEHSNGDKYWYQHDILHRDDGPAVEYANGNKEWYQHDQLHREDGPAIEFIDGKKEWWIKGKQPKVSSQEEFERYIKLKAFW